METTEALIHSLSDGDLVAQYEADCRFSAELYESGLDSHMVDERVDRLVDELLARGLA